MRRETNPAIILVLDDQLENTTEVAVEDPLLSPSPWEPPLEEGEGDLEAGVRVVGRVGRGVVGTWKPKPRW